MHDCDCVSESEGGGEGRGVREGMLERLKVEGCKEEEMEGTSERQRERERDRQTDRQTERSGGSKAQIQKKR